MNDLILIPRISEKAYGHAQNGIYMFTVPATANKQQVSTAVTAQYGVKVASVNVVIAKGKTKRTFRKGGAVVIKGTRKDVKKAYVRLAAGETLNLFTEEEK